MTPNSLPENRICVLSITLYFDLKLTLCAFYKIKVGTGDENSTWMFSKLFLLVLINKISKNISYLFTVTNAYEYNGSKAPVNCTKDFSLVM